MIGRNSIVKMVFFWKNFWRQRKIFILKIPYRYR